LTRGVSREEVCSTVSLEWEAILIFGPTEVKLVILGVHLAFLISAIVGFLMFGFLGQLKN